MPTTTELAAERGLNRGDPVVYRSTSLDTLSGALNARRTLSSKRAVAGLPNDAS
jgi:hypothetical protein